MAVIQNPSELSYIAYALPSTRQKKSSFYNRDVKAVCDLDVSDVKCV